MINLRGEQPTDAQFFCFEGRETSLVLYTASGAVPELIYWGPKRDADAPLGELLALRERPLTFASLEREAPLSLFPEESRGFSGSPALAMHRRGQGFVYRLHLNRVEAEQNTCRFLLVDETAGLHVKLCLAWSASEDMLEAWTEVKNVGQNPLSLDYVACPTLPLSPGFEEVLLLGGRWAGEFQRERCALPHCAALLIEQRSGRSGPEHFPGCVVGEAAFDESSGALLGAHLAWSGNYRLRLERLRDGRCYLQAGACFLPGEICLEPGESFKMPRLLATRADGLDCLSQRFHAYLRRAVLPSWTRQPRPVLANSWEAVYFDHDATRLEALVTAASAAGAERFVLDDGWFLQRRDDRRGLGDWTVDPEVYPEGLHPLIKLVQRKGMSFGLWVEPEMISPDSELFRAHPDWVLQDPRYPLLEARHQLVLNLCNPDAYSHIKAALSALLRSYPIDFLKWDMNRVLAMPADGSGRPLAWKQTEALYRLMDELREEFPALEIESCASGGGRADAAILQRCGRVWTSDNNDPLERLTIQAGFSLFFPPEIMGAHIGSERAHISGRRTDPHLRAIVALQGQLGFELDLSRCSPEELEILKPYVALYKKHRDWVAKSRVYRLPSLAPHLSCLGYVAPEREFSLWWISSRTSARSTQPEAIKLRGLDPARLYRLRVENQNRSELGRFMQVPPELLRSEDGLVATGASLMHGGFSLPVLGPETCLLLSCHSLHAP